MGCDIHTVIETYDGEKWVAVRGPGGFQSPNGFAWPQYEGRNYQFFAALANVRGEGPLPLGFPDDASETAVWWKNYWGRDGHSHGYLPLKDFAQTFLENLGPGQTVSAETRAEPWHMIISEYADPDKSRVVFWFDN